MAGRVLLIAPRTEYDFNSLGAGGMAGQVLARGIDVSQFTQADVAVRVHANGIDGSSAGTVAVVLYADGSTPEDPNNLKLMSDTLLASVAVDKADSEGTYKLAQFTGAMGSMLAVGIIAEQDDAQSYTLNAELSVELTLKD